MEKQHFSFSFWLGQLICFVLGLLVISSVILYTTKDKVTKTDTTQSVYVDTALVSTPVVETIQGYLEFRQQLKESQHKDSVFLTIPDVVLIHILQQFGTDLSIYEIATIYEGNKPVYDNVELGAEAQKYKDSIRLMQLAPLKPDTASTKLSVAEK